MSRSSKFFRALFFPPICRNCGERQTAFADPLPEPVCPACLKRWDAAREEICDRCGKSATDCRCMPEVLRDAGCEGLIRLSAYRPEKIDVTERLIFRCKEKRDTDVFAFLARPLAGEIAKEITDEEDALITWIPRRAAAVRQYGHDQASEIARMIGKITDVPAEKLLCRTPIGKNQAPQKTLTARERIEAASKSFAIVLGKDLDGKTVFLIDDVCTTGASLAACCTILRSSGARRVIAVTVAATERKT